MNHTPFRPGATPNRRHNTPREILVSLLTLGCVLGQGAGMALLLAGSVFAGVWVLNKLIDVAILLLNAGGVWLLGATGVVL